jgi:VanZ family protein
MIVRIPDTRLTRLLPAIAWMAVIFALSARSTIPRPRDLSGDWVNTLGHFSVYLVLGVLVWGALGITTVSGWRRAVVAVIMALAYGVTDEWHQSFVPDRNPDGVDLLVDGIGATCGMLLVAWLIRRQRSPLAMPIATPQRTTGS